MLETQTFPQTGGPQAARPLVIVHGLFGSGRNWGVIARRLSDTRPVITLDMRNHGASKRAETQSYADMADDLAQTIAPLGPVDLLGHSMGGKAAMMLALSRPDLVARLIVADIAPVAYTHSQSRHIRAMQAVDLDRVSRRSDAEAQLAALGVDKALTSFFTQSLDVAGRRWRLNLSVLEAEMDKIVGWPDPQGRFDGPVLFLTGALSDYVRAEHRQAIKALFPKAVFARIPGAGHWLHADRPREFEAAVRTWLDRPLPPAA